MPKPPKADAPAPPRYPIAIIGGGHPGLPPGLIIEGQFEAELLPDGRVIPLGLPTETVRHFYPDLAPPSAPDPVPAPSQDAVAPVDAAGSVPPPPTIEEI